MIDYAISIMTTMTMNYFYKHLVNDFVEVFHFRQKTPSATL